MLIDKLEKVGRLVLWMVLSAAVILGLVGTATWAKNAEAAQAELLAAKEELKKALEPKEPKEPSRIAAVDIGTYHSWLLLHNATGIGLFTNVSTRSGFICLQGVAKHPDGTREVLSLPACAPVSPYSSFKIEASFIGQDLIAMCGEKNQSGCHVRFTDAT